MKGFKVTDPQHDAPDGAVVIDSDGRIWKRIASYWEKRERICPECLGEGVVYFGFAFMDGPERRTCSKCNGEGVLS